MKNLFRWIHLYFLRQDLMDRQEIMAYEQKRAEIAKERIDECETEIDRLQARIDALDPPPLEPPERPVTADLIFLRKQAD